MTAYALNTQKQARDEFLPILLAAIAMTLMMSMVIYAGMATTYALFESFGKSAPLSQPLPLPMDSGRGQPPSLADCPPWNECPQVSVQVWSHDRVAFTRHLQLAARRSGGSYSHSYGDGTPEGAFLVRLPRVAAAELQGLNYRGAFFAPVVSDGYQSWAERWSSAPPDYAGASGFATLQVDIQHAARGILWLGPVAVILATSLLIGMIIWAAMRCSRCY